MFNLEKMPKAAMPQVLHATARWGQRERHQPLKAVEINTFKMNGKNPCNYPLVSTEEIQSSWCHKPPAIAFLSFPSIPSNCTCLGFQKLSCPYECIIIAAQFCFMAKKNIIRPHFPNKKSSNVWLSGKQDQGNIILYITVTVLRVTGIYCPSHPHNVEPRIYWPLLYNDTLQFKQSAIYLTFHIKNHHKIYITSLASFMTAKNSASTFSEKPTGLEVFFYLPQNKKKFKYII